MRPSAVSLIALLVPAVAVSQKPAASGGQAAGLADWNMEYAVPSGWQISRTLGRVQVLASTSDAGALFVAPGLYANFNEVALDIGKLYQTMAFQAAPVEQPATTTIAGMQAMTSLYASYDRMGQIVHLRNVAVLTPHGTGFVVVGMTTPQQMPGLRRTVDRLASSLRVGGPPRTNRQAVAALRGRWMFYAGRASGTTRSMGGSSRSHEEFVEFDGQGRFTWQSSSSVSVTTPGYAGGAGGASGAADRGTYTVIGTTLVVRGQQGQQTFEIQILGDRIIADGRTYLRAN